MCFQLRLREGMWIFIEKIGNGVLEFFGVEVLEINEVKMYQKEKFF